MEKTLDNVHMNFGIMQLVCVSNTLMWGSKRCGQNYSVSLIPDLRHSELSTYKDAKHVIVSCMGRCL